MTRPITSREIGEQSAAKPLAPFGSKSIRRPVREGVKQAEMDAAFGEDGK